MGEITRIVKLETVLHGGNGGGGLVGKIAKLKEDHEMRLRKLEEGQAKLIVIAGGVTGVISGVVVAFAIAAFKLLGG